MNAIHLRGECGEHLLQLAGTLGDGAEAEDDGVGGIGQQGHVRGHRHVIAEGGEGEGLGEALDTELAVAGAEGLHIGGAGGRGRLLDGAAGGRIVGHHVGE